MSEKRLELKVGALLVVAILGAVGLLALMGELRFNEDINLRVNFSHTGNVVEGAPVKLGGVSVGRVKHIALSADRRDEEGFPLPVQMELHVSKDALASLREDVAVTVATMGPLGEAYLELYTGSAHRPAFDASKVIRGLDAPRLDLVANRLSNFLESASRVLEENPRAMSTLVANITSLSENMDLLLKDNRPGVTALTAEAAASMKDLRQLLNSLRQHLPRMAENADATLEGIAAVSSQLSREDGVALKKALERYSAAGEKLEKIAERGDRLLAKLEAGEGTAGAVLKDPQVYDDLKTLIKDLRKNPWKVLWKD